MSRPSELHALDENMRDIVQKMASTKLGGGEPNYISEKEINQKLGRLHCPFTWKPFNDDNSKDVMGTIETKLSNVEDEGEEFTAWTTFVLSLILCYEYAEKGALDFAFEKEEECRKIVDRAILSGFSVPVMGIGLKHISDACKIFLLMKSNQFEEAAGALQVIIEIQEMEYRDQASIWSVRGALFLEYGLKGLKESIPFIERALQLDTECGEWHFLLGKALSRLRRIEDREHIPDQRELKAFEYAVSVSNNTYYMVLLAQSYRDASYHVHKHHGSSAGLKSLCNDMNKKALEMYKKAYENCNENPYVLSRCAFGFIKLPSPFNDVELAKDCIIKGLAKNPTSSFLNHTAGVFYQKQHDNDKAKYYFTRAVENGNYGACIILLSMKQKENVSYDPVPDLERYIDLFKEKPSQNQLFALLGAYYYFVKNDFNTALIYWSKVMDSDIDSVYLKTLHNSWPGAPHPCNISKTIVNEIIRRLDEGCSGEEIITYEKILSDYKKHHYPLVKSIQEVYSERSRYKNYCVSEQKPLSSASSVWHNMNRNSVGNYWKVRPAAQSAMKTDWKQKSTK